MRTAMLRRARALWNSPTASRETNRCNQLKWARAVARLGDKWLLAAPVERRSC
jgi:hypothetical protein